MPFLALLLTAAISLAAAAGFFSISGLAETYAASYMSVIIMAVCLEAAKVILASFIHNYWNKIRFVFRSLSCVMLAILMTITSYGVFSHLIAAYQQDNVSLTDVNQKLTQDKTELDRLVARKSQMDDQIAKLPNNYVKARTQLIKSFGSEYTEVPNRINQLNTEITDLSTKQTSTEAKIGPIIYLAKFLGQDPDITIIYFTGAITAVFDPLAILLVFAFNIALKVRREEKQNKTGPPSHTSMEDSLIVKEETSPIVTETRYSPLQNFSIEVTPTVSEHPVTPEMLETTYGKPESTPEVQSLPETIHEEIEPHEEEPEDVEKRMYDELRNSKKPVN
jgi:cell division protein FtsB